jgi:hypothetical protein
MAKVDRSLQKTIKTSATGRAGTDDKNQVSMHSVLSKSTNLYQRTKDRAKQADAKELEIPLPRRPDLATVYVTNTAQGRQVVDQVFKSSWTKLCLSNTRRKRTGQKREASLADLLRPLLSFPNPLLRKRPSAPKLLLVRLINPLFPLQMPFRLFLRGYHVEDTTLTTKS